MNGSPTITPSHLEADFGLSAELTAPLEAPWTDAKSFEGAVKTMRNEVAIDSETLRVALVLLQTWHTMLVGPPGTGKTMLAERAAELWNANLIRITPSMDWTAFHAIGGRAPSGGKLGPYDGSITTAVLDCCKTIVEREAGGDGPQATWLLIDEINRCEVDRVFTPLLSALGSRTQPQVLDLPYRDELTKRRLTLPPRFRIIATANLADAQFVEQMSQAFLRRFQRVDLRVPDPPASKPISGFSTAEPADADEDLLQELAVIAKSVAEQRPEADSLDEGLELLGQLLFLVRYSLVWRGYGTPPERVDPPFDTVAVGTAQAIDTLLLAIDLHGSPAGLTMAEAVDIAAARLMAPQLNRAGPDSLGIIREHLEDLEVLPRVCGELATLIRRFRSGAFF
jgi:5-methylcytosine-specific restriction enzyme B